MAAELTDDLTRILDNWAVLSDREQAIVTLLLRCPGMKRGQLAKAEGITERGLRLALGRIRAKAPELSRRARI